MGEFLYGKTRWTGDIHSYIQAMADDGFVFVGRIAENLQKLDLLKECSESSWPVENYRGWLKVGLWKLEDALQLATGIFPSKLQQDFGQLTQLRNMGGYPYPIRKMMDEHFYYCGHRKDWFNLAPVIKNYILLGDVYYCTDDDGEKLFEPRNLISWLEKHINYRPPMALALALGDSQEINNTQPRTSYGSDKREHELHILIGTTHKILKERGKSCAARDVWRQLQASHKQEPSSLSAEGLIDCGIIQEFSNNKIDWISSNGIEQSMTWGTFNNIVSDFKTGKKTLPDI